jgi:hypothetical protein
MTAPPGKRPFRMDGGVPLPLFVPVGSVDHFEQRYPDLWVVPQPRDPGFGDRFTAADLPKLD